MGRQEAEGFWEGHLACPAAEVGSALRASPAGGWLSPLPQEVEGTRCSSLAPPPPSDLLWLVSKPAGGQAPRIPTDLGPLLPSLTLLLGTSASASFLSSPEPIHT